MFDGFSRFEPIGAADHFVDRAEAELRHEFANFLRDELHEVHRVRWVAGEILAQFRVLRRDADRAGVQMANAHHDATERDERRGGKTKFLRAEQRGDDHVAAGFQLAVGFHHDAAAQIIQHQSLVRFGQAEFPRNARVLDRSLRRSAGSAVVSADQNNVRVRFGHTGRDGADADFGDELHADARVVIRVFQVVNQFRQIFDGINVVMRRRRNQSDAGRGVTRLGDPWIILSRREVVRLRRASRPAPF